MLGWEIASLLIVFTSVMVCALIIMLSRFFDFKMLEQHAKAELVFAASSVLVVLLLIGLTYEAQRIGKTIAEEMYIYSYKDARLYYIEIDDDGNKIKKEFTRDEFRTSGYSLIEITILYLRSIMRCAESYGVHLFILSMLAHELAPTAQDVFMHITTSGWVFSGLAQTMDNMLNTIYFLELAYRIQIYIMRFMDSFALPLFLPLGILLRVCPPTRGAGGYIIALSLGMYIIYPLAYLVVLFSSPYSSCTTPEIPEPYLGGTSKIGAIDELSMWFSAFHRSISVFLSVIANFSSALITKICFFPLVALAITMTFVQATSGLFGANIPEIGRGLLKLI